MFSVRIRNVIRKKDTEIDSGTVQFAEAETSLGTVVPCETEIPYETVDALLEVPSHVVARTSLATAFVAASGAELDAKNVASGAENAAKTAASRVYASWMERKMALKILMPFPLVAS